MNRTLIASTLDWRGNTKGSWKALIKDMTPDSTVTFGNGYTATVSGRTVSVTNTTAPVGTMTYETDLADAVSAGALYGAGNISDSLEAVAGDKTVRMGSVDLGTLEWTRTTTNVSGKYRFFTSLSGFGAKAYPKCVCSKYMEVSSTISTENIGYATTDTNFFIYDSDYDTVDATAFQSSVSGVMLYYELAEPTASTETPQSLSLTTGDDTLSGGSFDTTYEGTDYSILLIRNCKYLHRAPDGTESLVTGSTTNTSIDVKGGESKLVNLTHWFGRNREPSIEDFYKLYPTWKNYDIPYDQGSVLNYKGTGVQTIGFNAYNHATGTAALLGGNKYQICGTYTSVIYVDIFGNTETLSLDGAGCFTPVNDGTLTVTGGNGTDTCVHLVWSGYKNYGEPEYKWEPFTRNVKELPILTYFTSGMNGIGDAVDELTSEQKIVRIGVVDAGTLTWTKQAANSSYPYGYFSTTIAGRAPGDRNMFCTRYSWGENVAYADKIFYGNSTNSGVYLTDSSLLSLSDTELATALAGCLIYYELATPIVTQLDQPLNLAYPVNDFGTEHSLPQNTTTLVTTDLKALIKYNTDYMRMNSQLSGIFPTVKSLVQQEQDGYIMKKDDTAPNATVGNAFNLIDRNAEGTERQFSYDTSGGTQDITDGTAVAKKSMGTTLNLNQLVHDTNQNTVTGNGQVEVEDAVAGDVTSLVVEGRSLVRNQLVPPSLEETEDSADGVIEVNDAVAGDAKGLVMTAPRSVVVNQLVQNGDFSDGTTGWTLQNVTATVENNVITVAYDDSATNKNLNQNFTLQQGHTYCIRIDAVDAPSDMKVIFGAQSVYANGGNSWTTYSSVQAITSDIKLFFGVYNSNPAATVRFRNVQLVDLTQYFNGDTTLINSITSWDDLVTYDPRFASYVEYNTGTVSGVQPQVKVSGKNLINVNGRTAGTLSSGSGSSNAREFEYDKYYVGLSYNNYYYPSRVTNVSVSNGTVQFNVSSSDGNGFGIAFPIKLKQGRQYTKSAVVGTNNETNITFYDANGKYLSTTVNNTFTVPDNAETSVVVLRASAQGVSCSFSDIQLELGSVATSYEPYYDGGTAASPVPLYGVGTATDSYDVVTGKVGHKVSSVTLDGTQTFGSTSLQVDGYFTATYRYTLTDTTVPKRSLLSSLPVLSWSEPPAAEGIWCGGTNNAFIYVRLSNSKCTDTATMKTYLTSHPLTIYYDSVTPTEELLTPTSISLQTGNNVALQMDGGRTTPFNLTYDGTEFTLPLDSTHKYAYSDNGVKSIVTGANGQAVTGGQDMLVDITRMFNGDTTSINAVTSWVDMAAVMPEYLSNVAYNEGEVVGRSGGVTTAVWNQLEQNGNFADGITGWTGWLGTTAKSGNSLVFTVNSVASPYNASVSQSGSKPLTLKGGHKVLLRLKLTSSFNTSYAAVRIHSSANGSTVAVVSSDYMSLAVNTASIVNVIDTVPTDFSSCWISVYLNMQSSNCPYVIGDTLKVEDVQLFDLTEIYGAGHEPATVADFETDCDKWGKDLTQYQPYDAGTPMGGSATFSDLHGVGDVKETLDIVTGEKQVKYGEVDLGELNWTYDSTYQRFYSSGIASDVKHPITWSANVVCADYVSASGVTTNTEEDKIVSIYSNGDIYIRNKDYVVASAFKTAMSGVILYYELATHTTSSLAPQPLTFAAGLNNVHEENMDITGTPVTMEYTGTDYSIATKSARKYVRTVNGTTELVTGVSSVSVRGGRDNLIDLTRMFGAGLEPGTLDAFYSLFPTWRDYRLPYNKGSLLNFKGTGLKSVGFNLLDTGNRTLGQPQNTAVSNTTVRGSFDESKYYVGFASNNYYQPSYITAYSATSASVSVQNSTAEYGVAFPIRAIPGQTYRMENRVTGVKWAFYTYNGSYISSFNSHASVTAPADAYWCLILVAPSSVNTLLTWTDPCVHLEWSGTRNGDYEPYWDYIRPIPTLTYFPDGMNGRGTVYDEINPRQAIRRFSKVDLGTLNWTHTDSGVYGWWYTSISDIKMTSASTDVGNVISDNYVAVSSQSLSGAEASVGCMAVVDSNSRILVNTGSTTESPTGWLVYELATPVVTTFPEEISATARISDYGTEECLPTNGYEPVTAPFRGMVLYQDDYARTITKLPENYQSQASMDNLLTLIGPLLNGTITATFDPANQVYTYQFTPNA